MLSKSTTVICFALALATGAVASSTPKPSHQKRTSCSPGTYKSGGSCVTCTPGTYTSSSNAASSSPAPAGSFVSTHGSSSYTACPAGTFSTGGATSCSACTAGYYCPVDGMSAPLPCLVGAYSTGGATTCSLCSPGTFNSIATATGCCSCCSGFYQPLFGAALCMSCPLGASPVGASSLTQCKIGGSRALTCLQSGRNCPANTGPTGYVRKRDVLAPRCKRAGEKSCPVYSGSTSTATSTLRRYECVNVASDLESCGGCVTESEDGKKGADGGRDCSAIPHLGEVVCRKGECVIKSCRPGYVKASSEDGDICVLPTAKGANLDSIAEAVFQNMS